MYKFKLILLPLMWLIFYSPQISNASTNMVFGYFGSWAVYRPGNGRFDIEHIDVSKYTHLTYAFIGLNENGTVNILDPWADIDLGGFSRFVGLKERNPNLKVLVSMGGWNEGSERYSKVVNNPVLRSNLVHSVQEFLLRWRFDGFDFDWEYPAKRGGAPSDNVAYITFLRELRAQLGPRVLITAAVGANPDLIGTSYIVPDMNIYLDYINLMTYDYNSHHNEETGLNSPLFASSSAPSSQLNIDYRLV